MSGTIWSKFYWSDWLSDACLRRSSVAARGLWIDMLCIAAQSDPIGYLKVNNVPLTVNDIARMCGASEPETGTLIDELERNGVLSRDRTGTIYSRRMVRDEKKARTAKKNGKLGGNPTLTNHSGISASDNPEDKSRVNTHIPITNNQKPERKESRSADAPPDNVVPISRQYAFDGRVIKLSQADFDRWRKSYSALPDIGAALQAADDYYSEHPPKDGKWFFPASKWLEREHNAAKAKAAISAKEELRRRGDAW